MNNNLDILSKQLTNVVLNESGVGSEEKIIYSDYSYTIKISLRYFDGTSILTTSTYTLNKGNYFVAQRNKETAVVFPTWELFNNPYLP